MTIFISGGAKNGKSTLAQNLAVSLADGGKHYYVATMISTGAEDDERIRRHIADRHGLSFEIVECFQNILDCQKKADSEGAFSVHSVTTFLQNALFPAEKDYELCLVAAKRLSNEMLPSV